ncbi:ImmA/IrrE family metallo-endopeptidase [Aquitalea magnusonii]|uniref:ImmA/IrrE family metallo-endopeptidase n=1 Tax=Aquitalea magnusonii TaxID=332411 RepID=UPI000B5CD9DF|nr:ImmA/IrrE family metallo-endopeptidase [Aquitalea magnusonii]
MVSEQCSENSEQYFLRGQRVAAVRQADIEFYAKRLCKLLRLNSKKHASILEAIENLRTHHGIPLDLDPIEDDEWELYGIAEALCEPSSMTIVMPNTLYVRMAENDPEALFVLFHELGHIFLSHKPVLHFKRDTQAVQEEDAEWQADVFATAALQAIFPKGLPRQLSLF